MSQSGRLNRSPNIDSSTSTPNTAQVTALAARGSQAAQNSTKAMISSTEGQ